MSDKKTKTKKILIPILLVALLVIAICVFAVSKNKKNKNNNENNIIPISQSTTIEGQINSDIINQKVCQEYNGKYIFYGIADINFGKKLSRYEEFQIYQSITGLNIKDKNSFLYYLGKKKNYDVTGESISFAQGIYTKSINQTKTESGLYFGNLNKSIIYLQDQNGTTTINERNYSQSFDISDTGYWLEKNITDSFSKIENEEDIKIIYIREKLYYGDKSTNHIYVTYAYKMI